MSTTYRQTCGTRWGISMHVEKGEQPCGTCLAVDDAKRVRHELYRPAVIPQSGPLHDLQDVIRILAHALAEKDRATYRRTYRSAS